MSSLLSLRHFFKFNQREFLVRMCPHTSENIVKITKRKKKCIQTKPKYCRETKRSPINKFGTECIQRKENTNNYYETCTEPFWRDLTFQTSAPKRLPRGNILWTHEKGGLRFITFWQKTCLKISRYYTSLYLQHMKVTMQFR